MDFEEMKRQWSSMESRIDLIDSEIRTNKRGKMATAQEQLVTKYRRLMILGLVFSIWSPVFFYGLTDSVWLAVGFAVFFLISAVFDFILQRKVGDIDLASMPVSVVATEARSCRRLHHIFQIVLIPMAVVILAALAFYNSDNTSFIWGMAVGGAIGLALGLTLYFKMMDNYKSLTNSR